MERSWLSAPPRRLMPKEITHWAVAQQAADRAPEPHLRRIIRSNINLYLTGAFAVDSPYYVVRGGNKPLFAQAGARLHGRGKEGPFAAVLRVPAIATGVDADRAMTFTLGAITHVITDMVFHPMIYYLTGDYDDPDVTKRKKAVTLHRLLETWLDVWFAKKMKPENGGMVFRFTAQNSLDAKYLARLGSALFFSEKDMSRPARVAVLSHAVIQSLFDKRWAERLIGIYGRMARRDMGEFTALFYPPMTADPPSFFSKPIRYRNPFTGEAFEESLDGMTERAAQACSRWFNVIAENPDPMRLTETCQSLSAGTPLWSGRPVYFASEAERSESLRTLSVYKTAR